MAKALKQTDFTFNPNDLLGISYIKAILKNEFSITYETIKRTNSFHDNALESNIVSASNIREKIKCNKKISEYMPNEMLEKLVNVDLSKYFEFLKFKIITDKDLSIYLDVDEGIENRLIKYIKTCNSLDEFIKSIKTKRFTFNKINRMLVHIVLGITKNDAKKSVNYTKILGFNSVGQKYIKSIKKSVNLSLVCDKESVVYKYEEKAALIYEMLCGEKAVEFDKSNKPIKF